MFAGTLGRGQFFVKSGLLATAEAAVLAVCIAIQHEAFFGPPGEGRYRLAASVLLASIPFGYQRISLAIRRNRDAGGGQAVAGIYAIATCVAHALQIQALISRASDDPINGMEQTGLVYLLLGGFWLYLQFAASAPDELRDKAGAASRSSRSDATEEADGGSALSQAMEQAIAGRKPIPAPPVPSQPQGFLGALPAAVPRRRTEFGRRGLK